MNNEKYIFISMSPEWGNEFYWCISYQCIHIDKLYRWLSHWEYRDSAVFVNITKYLSDISS